MDTRISKFASAFKESNPYNSQQLAALFIATLSAYLVTSPPVYRYGVYNQASQLPLIKHAMDPSYLANDWVVNVRTEFISPKYYYLHAVETLAEIIGLPEAIFVLYTLGAGVIVAALWLFTYELFGDRLVATVTVGLVLAHGVNASFPFPYPPDLGGNSLLDDYLMPSHLANALIMAGLVYAARFRYRRSFALFGIASLIHVVNGFWMAVTVGLCAVVVEAGSDLRDGDIRSAVRAVPWDAALVYGTVASLVAVPLLWMNVTSGAGFKAAYITAWIRHPHHYVPSQWSTLQIAATTALVVTSSAVMYQTRDVLFGDERKERFVFTYVAALVSIMVVFGYVFKELIPVGIFINLHPFRVDYFTYIVLYGAIAKLLVIALHWVGREIDVDASTFSVATVTVAVVLATLAWSAHAGVLYEVSETSKHVVGPGSPSGDLQERYVQTSIHDDGRREAYEWIGSNTPRDAVFLASPRIEGFRLGASRARVVNFKSYPFHGDAPIEWEQRMNDVCDTDIRSLDGTGFHIANECGQRFHDLPEQRVREIAASYGATWILTTNGSYGFQQEFSAGQFYVYQIDNNQTA